MNRIALLAAAAAVALLVLAPVGRAQQSPLTDFKRDALTIKSADGVHNFQIEVATDDAHREQGLMFRHSMAPDAGMLFIYDKSQPVAMWMKNTDLPLDMLFIAADGHIVNIRQRAVPYSTEVIPSAGPVKEVLELNGGTVSRLGIKSGDKVIAPGLIP